MVSKSISYSGIFCFYKTDWKLNKYNKVTEIFSKKNLQLMTNNHNLLSFETNKSHIYIYI